MTKCGNFFRPEETKGREDSIWFHTSESSLRSLRLLAKVQRQLANHNVGLDM